MFRILVKGFFIEATRLPVHADVLQDEPVPDEQKASFKMTPVHVEVLRLPFQTRCPSNIRPVK